MHILCTSHQSSRTTLIPWVGDYYFPKRGDEEGKRPLFGCVVGAEATQVPHVEALGPLCKHLVHPS